MQKDKAQTKKEFELDQNINESLVEARAELSNNPWKTILIYTLFGGSWILFSDRILEVILDNPEKVNQFQTYKGWFYVAITAMLLYFLIKFDNLKIFSLMKDVNEKNQDLLSYSEELLAIEEELHLKIKDLNTSMDSLEKHKDYVNEIFNNSNTMIVIWSLEGEIIDVNQYFVELMKYEKNEVIGNKWANYIHPDETFSFSEFIELLKSKKRVRNNKGRVVTKTGETRSVLWNDKIIKNPNTDEYFIVSFGINVTLEKEKERKIWELAFTDKLTGLKNKISFENDIDDLIQEGQSFVLYYIDFDNFKNLNDMMGHNYGDRFLYDYSKSLKQLLPNHWIYRWSGDEFLIIDKSGQAEVVDLTVDGIMKMTRQKWLISEMEYYPSVSMGITRCPHDGLNVTDLLKNAEMALYKSKAEGKSQYRFYEKQFQSDLERVILIESSINKVLHSEGFVLNYQPIYHLKTMEITGFEVLLRWNDKDLTVSTGEVISIAEKTGQILDIDRWVIDNSFKCLQTHFSNSPYTMSINLSSQSLISNSIIGFIEDKIIEYGIHPSKVEFEVTEYSIIENFTVSVKIIHALKALGFKIALDDFGTRYSSLNYLSRIPFDTLKIDKSYIDNITVVGKDPIIVEQVIHLANKLGLKTIAEGIETESQREFLAALGCSDGQGYLMSRPVDIERLLEKVN